MQTKYDDITLTHNLSRVIIPLYRYKYIYVKGVYSIMPVVTLYDDLINRDATRTEVHQADGKHKVNWNDSALYETEDMANDFGL